MVQLFFSEKQEAEFRKIEEKLMKKYKLDNTTDTVLKAFKSIKI
jgi:shikimate kinase